MDYAGNSKRERSEKTEKPEKKVERVTKGEVLVQKKTLGRKFKELFIMADFRSVVQYVVSDVLLPAARNMIVDASAKGVERMMYGESSSRRRFMGSGGSRITYNNPINRGYPGSSPRSAPIVSVGSRSLRTSRGEDFILASRQEADDVLEQMNDIIDQYAVVTVADLNALVGFPINHIDNKWGWGFLGDVQVRQIREGYLIDLPPAESIG